MQTTPSQDQLNRIENRLQRVSELLELLLGPPGAKSGKFTVRILTKNYTFWSGLFLLRQARKIKRLWRHNFRGFWPPSQTWHQHACHTAFWSIASQKSKMLF